MLPENFALLIVIMVVATQDHRIAGSDSAAPIFTILLFLGCAFWTPPGAAQSYVVRPSSSVALWSSSDHHTQPTLPVQAISLPPKIKFSDALNTPDDMSSHASSDKRDTARAYLSATVPPGAEKISNTKFRWRFATQESFLFTGIMHTYNLATEAGTRDALNGPWLPAQGSRSSVRQVLQCHAEFVAPSSMATNRKGCKQPVLDSSLACRISAIP